MRDYFRSQSAMQLPSTVDNFRQHLRHHNTLFIAFNMNDLKEGPFAALNIESSENFILTYFQTPVWFYLLTPKYSLMGNVWRKTLLRCEMAFTALTEITI